MTKKDRPKVLLVGWDRAGITEACARSVSAFADTYLTHRYPVRTDLALCGIWLFAEIPPDFRPDLIYSTCEGSVPDAIELGLALGVPYHGLRDPNIPCDKYTTYRRLQAAGISVPRYQLVKSLDAYRAALQDFKADGITWGILKPRNAAGSAGVTKLDRDIFEHPDRAEALWLAHREQVDRIDARAYPRLIRGESLLQEFVHCPYPISSYGASEFAAEVFCSGTSHEILQVHEKWFMPERDPFLEPVYIAPPRFTDTTQLNQVRELVLQVTQALEFRRGLAHVEVRGAEQGLVVIDVAARAGGKLVSRAVKESIGFDLHLEAIRRLLGLNGESPANVRARPTALLALGAESKLTGYVKAEGLDQIRKLPSFRDALVLQKRPRFKIVDPARDYYADVVLSHEDSQTLYRDVHAARELFQIKRSPPVSIATWAKLGTVVAVICAFLIALFVASPGSAPGTSYAVLLGLATTLICAAVLAAIISRKVPLLQLYKVTPVLIPFAVAGWAVGSLQDARVQQMEESRPRLQVEARISNEAQRPLSIWVQALNEGKERVDLAYSRVCVFGISHNVNQLPGSCTADWSCWEHSSSGAIVATSMDKAISGSRRFWCERTNPAALCFRPFSKRTHLLPGERVRFEYHVPMVWLEKAPDRLSVRAQVDFYPDDQGLSCGVAGEGVSEYVGLRGRLASDDASFGSVPACADDSAPFDETRDSIADLYCGVAMWGIRSDGKCIVPKPPASECLGSSANSVVMNPAKLPLLDEKGRRVAADPATS